MTELLFSKHIFAIVFQKSAANITKSIRFWFKLLACSRFIVIDRMIWSVVTREVIDSHGH